MPDAQNVARALAECGSLEAFVTTFAFRRNSPLNKLLARFPPGSAEWFARQLARRSVNQVPSELIHSYPVWEILRSAAIKAGTGPVVADILWDHMSCNFDRLVARRYVPRTQAISVFEYAGLATFERAKKEGVARVLHLPSLDSREFKEIQRREKKEWPELVGKHDRYFDGKFERRYERRRQEIALADVIICNSSLTARSHIANGADASKVFAVPLSAPPAINAVHDNSKRLARPLAVLWAGPFSLRKGAHYLLMGWRQLNAKDAARLDVYGAVTLPNRLRASELEGIVFHGSVPKVELFEAYKKADVLVFPTLSDGFGMVVSEAMAHGLPVITTDHAGAADLVTPDNGLIIPAADPRAIAEALRWCLDNRARLAEMRHHALATARGRQWSDFRRDLIAALDEGLRKVGYAPSYGLMPRAVQ